MKPSVTMSTKISVVTAQKMNVCCGLAGPNSPMLNDPCQTTSTTDKARTKKPNLHLHAVDFDLIACHGPGNGDFVTGMGLHLVLGIDRVDLPLFGDDHQGSSPFGAFFGALLVAPHGFLARAVLVNDVAGYIG